MNYEDMSYLEINTKITSIVHDLKSWEFCENAKVFYRNDGPEYYEQPVIDYCNSWGDMGPLIEESDIMMNPNFADGLWKAEQGFRIKPDGFYSVATAYDKNPLHAAAICWLMVHDAKTTPGN